MYIKNNNCDSCRPYVFSISSRTVSMPIYFLFMIGSAVTFDNLPLCHGVVQISLNSVRGEQLLHKLKACRTAGL